MFEHLSARMDELGIPAAAVAVASPDGLDWISNGGEVFQAASLGKPIAAYAAMKLLDLDAPIFRDGVTARHVMSHTSGLPNWRKGEELEFRDRPGQRFCYSGEGFGLLQAALERAAGRGIEELMQEHVFGPLGMQSSSFGPHAHIAHSLTTTAEDLGRFLVAFLGDPVAEQMTRPVVRVNAEFSWGLGWCIQRDRFSHHGANQGGHVAYCAGELRSRRAFALLARGERGLELAPVISDAVLGGKHQFYWEAGFD